MKTSKKFKIVVLLAILIIIIGLLSSGFFGSADMSFRSVVNVIRRQVFNNQTVEVSKAEISIIWKLRIPRTFLAIFIGGGLAIAGAGMQSVTQNILAEPYILGISSGSLAFVTFFYFIESSFIKTQLGRGLVAFIGAFVSLLLVYLIIRPSKKVSNSKLILAGIAVSALLNALSSFFIIATPNSNAIKGIISWTMGSLAGARLDNILLPAIIISLASIFFIYRSKDFDLISLGDETALSLGVDVSKLKKQTVLVVSLIAGISVASCGMIGFVGFIIPHIVRKLVSSSHRYLYPLSFLCGGSFLILMDILARSLLSPQDIPIGVMTAIFGAPVFILVLKKERL